MARTYALSIGDSEYAVAALAGDDGGVSAKLTLNLNAPSTLDVTLDAGSDALAQLYADLGSGLPIVRLTRDGTTVFYGLFAGMTGQFSDTGEMAVSFIDGIGMMEHAPSFYNGARSLTNFATDVCGYGNATVWPQTLAATPAYSLTRTGSPSGTAYLNTAEASNELEMINNVAQAYSFDWYVDHANAAFKVANTHGTDKSATVLFGFSDFDTKDGEGFGSTRANLQSFNTSVTPPVNDVYCSDNAGRVAHATDATSIEIYGRWMEQRNSGPKGASGVANAALRTVPVTVNQIIADPQLAPQWLTDYYLGDTVQVTLSTPAFVTDQGLRVNQIVVDFDDQLIEISNTLSFEDA